MTQGIVSSVRLCNLDQIKLNVHHTDSKQRFTPISQSSGHEIDGLDPLTALKDHLLSMRSTRHNRTGLS